MNESVPVLREETQIEQPDEEMTGEVVPAAVRTAAMRRRWCRESAGRPACKSGCSVTRTKDVFERTGARPVKVRQPLLRDQTAGRQDHTREQSFPPCRSGGC